MAQKIFGGACFTLNSLGQTFAQGFTNAQKRGIILKEAKNDFAALPREGGGQRRRQ